jgi:hypothetical protein
MSKQGEAKIRQGYDQKPIPRTCGNCANFRSEFTEPVPECNKVGVYREEKNMRCCLGGFAVKKKGTCREYDELF